MRSLSPGGSAVASLSHRRLYKFVGDILEVVRATAEVQYQKMYSR